LRRIADANMAQFGLFKVAQHVKRMAVHQGKDRMAGGGVIADAGGEVGHPAVHRRFDDRLAELPLRMFQRRFADADSRSGGRQGGGGGIQGGIDVLKVFSRDGILRQVSATAASLAALLCSACAFATSACAFASCAWAFSTAMR
jgi:hypothetical protein